MTKLADHAPLLLVFVKFVLLERVSSGDNFLSFVKQVEPYINLDKIFFRVPLPTTINNIESAFQAKVYRSATLRTASVFDSALPNKTAADFIDFAFSIPQITASSWLIALIYVDRLICICPSIVLTTTNFHKFFSAALMIAVKYHEEWDIPLATFADLALCTREEMKAVEICFLKTLDYRLHISDEDMLSAEIGIMSYVMFVKDDENVARALQARQITTLHEALRLRNLWDLLKETPHFAKHIPHCTPFAMIHGDARDMWRLTYTYSALARAQMETEFGPLVFEIDFLLKFAQALTVQAQRRLNILISIMQGVLPIAELERAGNRFDELSRDAHSGVDLRVVRVAQMDGLSPWSISAMSDSFCMGV